MERLVFGSSRVSHKASQQCPLHVNSRRDYAIATGTLTLRRIGSLALRVACAVGEGHRSERAMGVAWPGGSTALACYLGDFAARRC
jgi:hypothetical protein